MRDLLSIIRDLRRPGLLLRTARAGVPDYRRDGHLRRLLGPGRTPAAGVALARLLQDEDDVEQCRRDGQPGYSAVRHVDLLIAIMAEARLLRDVTTGGDGEAPGIS